MKFEQGKYYLHEKRRCISVVGRVTTKTWGDMFVIEETDKTGYSISCVEVDSEVGDRWVEIGKAEWLRRYEEKPRQHLN